MQIIRLVLQGHESILQGQEIHDLGPDCNGNGVCETDTRKMERDGEKVKLYTNIEDDQ